MDKFDESKPIELIFHNIHDHGVQISDLWMQEVERRSGGKVRFTGYTGGGPEITRKADVIRDVPAGGGQYPLLDLVQTPLVFPDAVTGSRVIGQLYAEFAELRDELSDVKVVGLSIGALMALFSSQNWGPIRSLEDFKGARTRSLGPIDEAIATLGARPVPVNYTDISRQLENGELDAAVLGMLPAKSFDLAKHGAPFCTLVGDLSITMHPMRTYMKRDSWNRLPPDIQNIIDELGPSGADSWFVKQSGVDSDRHLPESLDYYQQYGEVIRLNQPEVVRWQNILQPLREKNLKKLDEKGLPGRKFFRRMLELAECYSYNNPVNE